MVRRGESRRSVAILYRSNAQSRVLEEALLRERIPYRIYGGQRFYERLEIRNALAYLRLAQARRDDAALERVLNTPPRGIGNKTVEKLREVARRDQASLWEAIDAVRKQTLLPARALTALANFQALIDDFGTSAETLSLDEFTEHVIEMSGLMNYHRSEKVNVGKRGWKTYRNWLPQHGCLNPRTSRSRHCRHFWIVPRSMREKVKRTPTRTVFR